VLLVVDILSVFIKLLFMFSKLQLFTKAELLYSAANQLTEAVEDPMIAIARVALRTARGVPYITLRGIVFSGPK
jgi:hypothetical protein